MQILFTDRVLPTTRCRDKILGGGELSPYRPKVMAACTFILSSTFLLHRLVLYCFSAFWEGVHTSHGWGDMEFASRSSAEWRGSHPWAITCSISVQSFCMQRYSSVAKMHMAPEKFNIYAKFCNEHDPWHNLQDSKPCSHIGLLVLASSHSLQDSKPCSHMGLLVLASSHSLQDSKPCSHMGLLVLASSHSLQAVSYTHLTLPTSVYV